MPLDMLETQMNGVAEGAPSRGLEDRPTVDDRAGGVPAIDPSAWRWPD